MGHSQKGFKFKLMMYLSVCSLPQGVFSSSHPAQLDVRFPKTEVISCPTKHFTSKNTFTEEFYLDAFKLDYRPHSNLTPRYCIFLNNIKPVITTVTARVLAGVTLGACAWLCRSGFSLRLTIKE